MGILFNKILKNIFVKNCYYTTIKEIQLKIYIRFTTKFIIKHYNNAASKSPKYRVLIKTVI